MEAAKNESERAGGERKDCEQQRPNHLVTIHLNFPENVSFSGRELGGGRKRGIKKTSDKIKNMLFQFSPSFFPLDEKN